MVLPSESGRNHPVLSAQSCVFRIAGRDLLGNPSAQQGIGTHGGGVRDFGTRFVRVPREIGI